MVPIYKVEEYIRECVESILNQSYTNLEILLINDGTPDNSIGVINDLFTDTRLKVINQDNAGLSAARNTGLKYATGKYVAMIDSDDAVKPDFIKNLLTTAIETNAQIVRGSFRDFDGNIPDGWVADFTSPVSNGITVLNKFLDNNTSFVVWSSLYDLNWLKENNLQFTKGILLEDGDFTTRAYMKASNVVAINTTDYKYRIRPGSILTSNNAQRMSDSEQLVIQNFIENCSNVKTQEEVIVIKKAIYGFMRDWTRILVNNKLKFDSKSYTYTDALLLISSILKSRPLKERLKFKAKLTLIKIKY